MNRISLYSCLSLRSTPVEYSDYSDILRYTPSLQFSTHIPTTFIPHQNTRSNMRTRLAACEPCRKAKLACDHTQPVCARCRSGNRPRSCIYRAAPFKRKTRANSGQSSQQYAGLSVLCMYADNKGYPLLRPIPAFPTSTTQTQLPPPLRSPLRTLIPIRGILGPPVRFLSSAIYH